MALICLSDSVFVFVVFVFVWAWVCVGLVVFLVAGADGICILFMVCSLGFEGCTLFCWLGYLVCYLVWMGRCFLFWCLGCTGNYLFLFWVWVLFVLHS